MKRIRINLEGGDYSSLSSSHHYSPWPIYVALSRVLDTSSAFRCTQTEGSYSTFDTIRLDFPTKRIYLNPSKSLLKRWSTGQMSLGTFYLSVTEYNYGNS